MSTAGLTPPDKPWNKMKPDEKKAADPARAKKETRTGIIGLVVILLFVGGCVAAVGGDDEERDTVAQSSEADPTPAASKSTKTSPKPSPSPEVPATPAEAFEKKVKKELGKSNRDVKRVEQVRFENGVAQVTFAAQDNLTENLTKTSARLDTLEIIKAAKKLPGLTELNIIATFTLQNQLGEVSEDPVGNVTYSGEVVQRIQPDTIDTKKVWDVADIKSFTHPAFAY